MPKGNPGGYASEFRKFMSKPSPSVKPGGVKRKATMQRGTATPPRAQGSNVARRAQQARNKNRAMQARRNGPTR